MATTRNTLEVATQELPDSQVLVENILANSSQVEHYGPEYQDQVVRSVVITGSDADHVQYEPILMGPSAATYLAGHTLGALADSAGYSVLHGGGHTGNLGSSVYLHGGHSLLSMDTLPYPPAKHPSLQKPEHEDSRAKRRGPMDEMRQLVRIMVKFLPQSLIFLHASDEPGGGNRVTEPQIKAYLKATLGDDAPQPTWGMPQGWGAYLADLFTWALGRQISDDEARSCACRQQGRSWQVKETRLAELGIFAYSWPLPLSQEGVLQAQLNPGDPPPGSNFIGPPPGWPHVELPAPILGRPAMPVIKSRSRAAADVDIQPASMMSRPMAVVRTMRPAGPSPGRYVYEQQMEETDTQEFDYLSQALKMISAATNERYVNNGIDERPGDKILLIVDRIQSLLDTTYGSRSAPVPQPAPPPPAPAKLVIAHSDPAAHTTTTTAAHGGVSLALSDTPRVRASRALLDAQIQAPIPAASTYSPSKVVASLPGASPRSVLAGSMPRSASFITSSQHHAVAVGGKGVSSGMSPLGTSKLPSSQPTMDDLVSAAMSHAKANGDVVTTTSETDEDGERAGASDAGDRKRRRTTSSEIGSEMRAVEAGGAEAGEDRDEEGQRMRRQQVVRARTGSETSTADGAGGSGDMGPSTSSGQGRSTGGGAAASAAGGSAGGGSAVNQLRKTLLDQIVAGSSSATTTVSAGAAAVVAAVPAASGGKGVVSGASIQGGRQEALAGPRVVVPASNTINGIAVAGADMLPLGSLPISSRSRSAGPRKPQPASRFL